MTLDDPLALSGINFDDDDEVVLPTVEVSEKSKEILSDVANHEEEIVSLESRIDNCLILLDTITKTKGMSRSFAEEAQTLVPNFSTAPLAYYSLQPTKTQYNAAIEGLSTGIMALIAAGIAAAIALIYKVYKWLTGGKEEADADDVVKVAENSKKVVDTVKDSIDETRHEMSGLEKMVRQMNATLTDAEGKEYRCTSLDMFVEKNITGQRREVILKYQKLEDPVLNDIIRRGPMTKLALEVTNATKHLLFVLEAKLRVVKEMHVRDTTDYSQSAANVNAIILEKFKKDSTVKFNGKDCTFKEIAFQLSEAEKSAHNTSQGTHSIKFDNLITTVYEHYNSQQFHQIIEMIESSSYALDRFRTVIADLQKRIGKFTTDGLPGKSTEGMGEGLREIVRAITEELNAYSKILIWISAYKDKNVALFSECVILCDEVISKFHRAAQAAKVEIPNEWVSAAENVHRARRDISEAMGVRFFNRFSK